MQYLITFLEGIISFISPCMLPMLPVYVSFFAGSTGEKKNVLLRAIAFAVGFTVVFSLLGVFAGVLGSVLERYKTVVNAVCGAAVVVFGLSYLEIIPLNFFKGMKTGERTEGIVSSFVFGIIYSVSLTPCVGAFLGSAIMLASTSGNALKGLSLLVVYSLGIGIPFVLSAVMIDRLESAFVFIKRHYKTVNTVCGVFLIIVGIAMAFDLLGRLTAII